MMVIFLAISNMIVQNSVNDVACQREDVVSNKRPGSSLLNEQVRVRRHEGYLAAERRLGEKHKTVCVIGPGEIIGLFIGRLLTRRIYFIHNTIADLFASKFPCFNSWGRQT